MHDCVTARETAAGLLRTAQDRSLPASVAGCPDCEAWCSEAATAIGILGRAVDASEPQDEYWEGYETRLFARIAIQSRKRVVRKLAWGFAAAVTAGVVMTVISVRDQPTGSTSPSIVNVSPRPTFPESTAATRPPNQVTSPRTTTLARRQPSISLTFDLGRHLESVRLLLISVKNGGDDLELDRHRARRLLEQHVSFAKPLQMPVMWLRRLFWTAWSPIFLTSETPRKTHRRRLAGFNRG